MKTAIYAGSFDPCTQGHWNVIRKGMALFDYLIVAIGVNPNKNCMFTPEERKEMIEADLNAYDQQHVKVSIFRDEFLVDYAKFINTNYILRGIRDTEDFRQEQAYCYFNKKAAPEITTVFVMPDPDFMHISSSAIKSMIGPKGWEEFIKPYVTTSVHKKLIEKFSKTKGDFI